MRDSQALLILQILSNSIMAAPKKSSLSKSFPVGVTHLPLNINSIIFTLLVCLPSLPPSLLPFLPFSLLSFLPVHLLPTLSPQRRLMTSQKTSCFSHDFNFVPISGFKILGLQTYSCLPTPSFFKKNF